MKKPYRPDRIQELMDAHDPPLYPRRVEDLAGLRRGAVSELLMRPGNTTSLEDRLIPIAKVLGCDVEYLTGYQQTPRLVLEADTAQGIRVEIECEAEAWRQKKRLSGSATTIPMLANPNYPGIRNLAGVARRDGANLAGIDDGTYFIFLSWEDWVSQGRGAIQSGGLYVVQRENIALDKVEISLRTAQVSGARVTFHAPSDDDDYESFVNEDTSAFRVKVLGVVSAIVRLLLQ